MMSITDLIIKLQKLESKGYGDKDIYVEDGQTNYHIDSIQKNTHPDIAPEYFFLMAGSVVKQP